MKNQILAEGLPVLSCPVPICDYKNVLLAHGGGGRLSQQIIQKMFISQFQNEYLERLHDGAIVTMNGARLAFSTDSYVINPIFFPGGNIGTLAVNGTVNDLAMCGATPLYLSAAFIIEEGFAMDELWRVVLSMQEAAKMAGVQLVTGDTKVVDKGKGDKIILNGTIAAHGIAIMSVREGLEFRTGVESDCAPLNDLVRKMFGASKQIHVLRDPTRGALQVC